MFLMAFIWAIDFSIRPYLLKILLNYMAEQGVAERAVAPVHARQVQLHQQPRQRGERVGIGFKLNV